MAAPFIVGIRFHKVNKIYHFDASHLTELEKGDYVIVSTARGRQIGEVIQTFPEPPETNPEGWKPVERKATPRDLVLHQIWQQKEAEAALLCASKAHEMGFEGMKIVAAEFSFDGHRLGFLYSTELDLRDELDDLRIEMQRHYPNVKIDMRLIGPRDVAKLLEGMGSCGLETRCCAKFLTSFNPISVKMAKAQQISLTSMEITGMCGRLRCCMVYEYEAYEDIRKSLPKRGKRVFTPRGEGKVVTLYPLKGSALIALLDGSYREYNLNELTPWSEAEEQRRLSQPPEVIEKPRPPRPPEVRERPRPPRPPQESRPVTPSGRSDTDQQKDEPQKQRSGRSRRHKFKRFPPKNQSKPPETH